VILDKTQWKYNRWCDSFNVGKAYHSSACRVPACTLHDDVTDWCKVRDVWSTGCLRSNGICH